jgi:uncharacterized coiled-coil protein SlyX
VIETTMRERDGHTESGAGDPAMPARAAPGARDLEPQIATLAAQVKQLAERLVRTPARSQPPGAPNHSAAPPANSSPARVPDPLNAGMLATAESVAAEIRAGAEREAERIRADARSEANARIAGLHAMIARQRDTLAALAAEIGHLEHSATTMRSQARALDAELHAIDQAISAAAPRET